MRSIYIIRASTTEETLSGMGGVRGWKQFKCWEAIAFCLSHTVGLSSHFRGRTAERRHATYAKWLRTSTRSPFLDQAGHGIISDD